MLKNNVKRPQIFQSFDALKGFRELLKEQEKIVVSPKILLDDELEELDYKVHQIQKGMMISITYFENHQYIKIEGIVSKINLDTKFLQIVKTKIDLRKIIKIEFI